MIHRPRSGSRPAGLIARDHSVTTARLILRPIPLRAAAALPADRTTAAEVIGAELSPEWPLPDLLDILPLQAAAAPWQQRHRPSIRTLERAGFERVGKRDGVIDWQDDRGQFG